MLARLLEVCRRAALGLVGALVALGAAQPAAAQPAADACSVYFHADFRGPSLAFKDGEDAPWFGSRWNDQVSSVRVAEGCALTVWEDVTFGGLKAEITRDTAYVGPTWNDRISSSACRCERRRSGRGDDQAGGGRDGDRRLFGRDSRDAPARLSKRGVACVLHREPDFTGAWRGFLDGDSPERLGRRLNQDVSSVRVADGCVAVLDIGEPFKLFVDQNVRAFPPGISDTARSVDCFCR